MHCIVVLPVLYLLLLFTVSIFSKPSFWTEFLISRLWRTDKIPGPFLLTFSRLWLVKVLASGDSARILAKVNKDYGLHIAIAYEAEAEGRKPGNLGSYRPEPHHHRRPGNMPTCAGERLRL